MFLFLNAAIAEDSTLSSHAHFHRVIGASHNSLPGVDLALNLAPKELVQMSGKTADYATRDNATPWALALRSSTSERTLTGLALALGARSVAGWSQSEELLAASQQMSFDYATAGIEHAIRSGYDPLGESFARLRTIDERRPMGATYTPAAIVDYMMAWAKANGKPARIVDPGAGSSRFLLKAGKCFPDAELVGIELDPLAALLSRANLAAAGFAARSRVVLDDYRSATLPKIDGPTLYVGNPPYVRHHLITTEWKQWLGREAGKRGYRVSRLAGLHAYFFLATALRATKGDYGIFITSAEWLDVNYGLLIHDLFLDRLGGLSILLVDPTAEVFSDAATTSAITAFRIEARPKSVSFRRAATLADMVSTTKGRSIRRERLETETRWSHLSRCGAAAPAHHVELGELFRVHRGQVTGANKVWIDGEHSRDLPPSILFPCVTKARELLRVGLFLKDPSCLRNVIDIPTDLTQLDTEDRRLVDRFLVKARAAGADLGYIARNRRAWWSVGLKEPAPILATYMARRPPAFVRNLASARHINIAHGLYPRENFSAEVLDEVVKYLSSNISVSSGRTYAGGLTKFEPREMERLTIPLPTALTSAK
jgi:adenine-specific DNA-methyltransferase